MSHREILVPMPSDRQTVRKAGKRWTTPDFECLGRLGSFVEFRVKSGTGTDVDPDSARRQQASG